jgi:hypothetical protein
VREGAESALCGIPRSARTNSGIFDELVCPDCIVWLPKRMEASRKLRKVERD